MRPASPHSGSARGRRSRSSSPISCWRRSSSWRGRWRAWSRPAAASCSPACCARRNCRRSAPICRTASRCEQRIPLEGWVTLVLRAGRGEPGSAAGRSDPRQPGEHCRCATQPIDWPHVRSPLPVIRRRRRPRRERRAGRGAAHRTGAARADRPDRAARRPPSERICAGLRGAARLAHRLHRLGRARDRADGPRRAVRRRPLHPAGARSDRSCDLHHRASGRDAAEPLDRAERHGRRAHRLRSVAAHGRRRRAARQGLRGGRRHARCGRRPIRSIAIWNDRPPPPLGADHAARPALRRRGTPRTSSRASAPSSPSSRPTRWWSPTRTRWPGRSTSAAPMWRIRRCRSPSRSCRRKAGPRSMSTAASCRTMCATASKQLADVREPADFERDLEALGAAQAAPYGSTRRPPPTRWRASSRTTAARSTRGADPIALMKAVKNPVEIAGARAAQVRDGAAVARFLAWFDREAPQGKLTEIDAVEALESFRRDTGLLKDVSFPTIAGAGPNGAIVHYRVTDATNRHDPAGRAFPDRFRRPVRGRHHRHHPHGRGRHAERRDARPLHPRAQGPHRDRARGVSRTAPPVRSSIRSRASSCGRPGSTSTTAPATASAAICRCTRGRRASPSSASTPLKRGMILSNEPGYYKTGAYGIRIENLVLVVEAPASRRAPRSRSTRFETLTLAPIDLRLVVPEMLSGEEIRWLDAYHAPRPGYARRRWSTPRPAPGSRPPPARSGAR